MQNGYSVKDNEELRSKVEHFAKFTFGVYNEWTEYNKSGVTISDVEAEPFI